MNNRTHPYSYKDHCYIFLKQLHLTVYLNGNSVSHGALQLTVSCNGIEPDVTEKKAAPEDCVSCCAFTRSCLAHHHEAKALN